MGIHLYKIFPMTVLILIAGLPAVQVYAQNGSDPVTETEMQTLANAMDTAVLDIDRYVTLENLNDISETNPTLPFDSIKQNSGVFSIIPSMGTFLPRKDFTVGPLSWNGPYVNYQSNRIQTGSTPYDEGTPLDRWGNPYYLFNPLGLLRGDQGIITLELYGDRFDRYTIVSLGPDGIMSSDDIVYPFNGALDGSYLTSMSGAAVTRTSPDLEAPEYRVIADTTATLRGYNLGSSSQNRTVMFGSTVITDVLSWSPREVVIHVSPALSGTDNFQILINGNPVGSLRATIVAGDTRVSDWKVY